MTPVEACDPAAGTNGTTPCARAVTVDAAAVAGGGGGSALAVLGPAVPTASPIATTSVTPSGTSSAVTIGGRGTNETGGDATSGAAASSRAELAAWLLSAVAGTAGVLAAAA